MPDVMILKKKSYLAMIRNSVRGQTHLFRNLYARVDGVEHDILGDGQLSCAAFVSAVLTLNGLLDEPHATVEGTEKDMALHGWEQITELRDGAVITWAPVTYEDGTSHGHIGFYIGDSKAISNASNASGIPAEHSATYDGTRAIERIWWHQSLDE
jgi:hypothetical protein